jgi:hypothetical protein
MKPTQTVLLLVIMVVMIFAVTFASMYVRDSTTNRQPDDETQPPPLALSFDGTSFPELLYDEERIVTEYGQSGQHDFWFKNENDQEVTVGLISKNCTCSDVRLLLAPEAWRTPLERAEAQRDQVMAYVGPVGGGLAGRLAGAVPLERARAELLQGAADSDFRTLADDPIKGIVVPPRTRGVVRVLWHARRTTTNPYPQNLSAQLWVQNPQNPAAPLLVGALLVDPIRLDREEANFGILGASDAETKVLYCWSSTRPNFRLKARPTGEPFVRCQVEKINEEERRTLRGRIGPVLAGYRVTVSVRERIDDRTRSDEGVFQHRVELFPSDGKEKLGPLEVTLRGLVRGDVLVQGAETGIALGQFPANRGTRHEVTLSVKEQDLDLQVAGYPPFMTVELKKEKTSGNQRWKLQLVIGRDQAAGAFPRADNEIYKDTAIYLKIGGEGTRRLRIPVLGTATN